MSGITQKMLNDAGGALKKRFLEFGDQQIETFNRITGNLPVSLKVTWKPSQAENQMNCDIAIAFKLDEVKDQESFTFIDGNGPIFDRDSTPGGPTRTGAIEDGGEAETVSDMRPGLDYDVE